MFDLTNSIDEEALEKFRVEHKNCPLKHLGKKFFSTTGGQYSYIVTPTGLGPCVEVRCNACNETKDITNCDNW